MIEGLIGILGDDGALGAAGLAVGLVFGVMAQRSRFCLRAATVEVAEGHLGPKLSIWLIAFFTALALVQGAVAPGFLDLGAARVLAATGSLSGAILGGLIFGAGMVLARGCASRLLVLASSGNLRALITGLVVTLVAQAAYRGALSPARETIAGLWTVPGGDGRDLGLALGLSSGAVAGLALAGLAASFVFARRRAVPLAQALTAAGVGAAVMLGWLATYLVAQTSFEVVPLSSVTFTGPATDTLMALVTEPSLPLSFGIGLVPGVALGAGAAALLAGEWKLERFGADTPMERYLIGAVLMGFGAMLAGGCAVGAGMSGGAALSVTAWIAVLCMWLGAMATHRLMTRAARPQAA
ncbi:MAG: YeeE/YedE family protein [Proteobacteria bacterium]|nr:YeeE/YedE family protein [Pseudomonadota bacterium]